MLSHEWAARRMDMIERIVKKNHGRMEQRVYGVPEKIDTNVAGYALDAMGIAIDEVTNEQRRYQNSS